MKTFLKNLLAVSALVASLGFMLPGRVTAQTFTTLHRFQPYTFPQYTNSDGANPSGDLILAGNTLYGTTPNGGSYAIGTVFAVNTDGTGFTNLHSFGGFTDTTGSNNDGGSSTGGLVLSGNTLYGTARGGGSSANGTLFAVNTDGTGFTILHTFSPLTAPLGANSDGAQPQGELILSGNTLYGTANFGGSFGHGTVFAINTDGTGFSTLHSFTAASGPSSTNNDGALPVAGLILSGNTLYGTTPAGGITGNGTVFAVNIDGTGFSTLHSFTSAGGEGVATFSGLILSGNTLYGTTYAGGTSGYGTVFAIHTDGTGFTTLHNLTFIDGGFPRAELILSGNTLYGTASVGGTSGGSGSGTVFAVNTDGTGFMTLHSFTGGSNGTAPIAGLVLSGTTLYGTAHNGGNSSNGTVFSLSLATSPPTPTPTPTPNGGVQFSAGTAIAAEILDATTKVDLTVTRTGDTSGAASIHYSSSDVSANDRSDYLAARGTVRFLAGETSKTISVFIVDDSFGEGAETFNVTLSNPVGCALGAPATVNVTINSNETVNGQNPVRDPGFNSDFFVRQHYLDFFNREGDPAGLAFWKNQIDECTTQACREIRRINVSAAFFLSIEFQQTGYLVYKANQAAFNSGEQLRLQNFLADTQEIGRGVVIGENGADLLLETNKQNFFLDFVQRPVFLSPFAYPTTLTPEQFVDKLNGNTLDPLNPGSGPALTPSQRDALVTQLAPDPTSPTLRAQVLRAVSENGIFTQRQFNKAFVLMQYFGYMRRNPDALPDTDFGGYNFWLSKLNEFSGNFVNAEMVKAFIISGEYVQRFGP
jgi:uncharacterized repeat protein (TIGR03803 family)